MLWLLLLLFLPIISAPLGPLKWYCHCLLLCSVKKKIPSTAEVHPSSPATVLMPSELTLVSVAYMTGRPLSIKDYTAQKPPSGFKHWSLPAVPKASYIWLPGSNLRDQDLSTRSLYWEKSGSESDIWNWKRLKRLSRTAHSSYRWGNGGQRDGVTCPQVTQ